MQAVIEMKNGDIETIVGVEGYFSAWVDEWLEDNGPRTAAIWCVMDEIGESWDQEAEPYWIEGQTRRYMLHGPAGSGVIELPWTGEPWEVLMEREYPKTYEAMETFDVDDTEGGPVLDDDEAALLFAEEGSE